MFVHPGRERDSYMWNYAGEIMNGFALNTAITGSANVNVTTGQLMRVRNSWLGGTQSAIPDVASAMILMEFGSSKLDSKTVTYPIQQTVYPAAWREFWGRLFMKWTTCSGANMSEISNEPDSRAVFANGIVLGMADGSAKFVQAGKFLANTPLQAEYGPLDSYYACGTTSEIMRPTTPNLSINYPMWGLTAQ
jgi:hypothetical protein